MLKLYTVKIISSSGLPENSVTLSTDLQLRLNLKSGHLFTLQAGTQKAVAYYLGCHGREAGTSICCAENVRQNLLLPGLLTLNLNIEADFTVLHLGPLIGIFAHRSGKRNKPFGEQTGFFSKLHRAAEGLNSFCFAFSPQDIDWQHKTILGSFPVTSDTGLSEWQSQPLPFPDVIYDRGLFPKGEKRRAATAARKVLRKSPDLKFFNPAFFGKWKTHKLLSRNEILCDHLPETKLITNTDDIFELLGRHETVYLKPSGGSSGRGIIQVKNAAPDYSIQFRTAKQVNTLDFRDSEHLVSHLKLLMSTSNYIVQQGLPLALVGNCPIDIRVLMQRNSQGTWLRTGQAARVANEGSFLSNIHAGGHAAKISDILPMIFNEPKKVTNILQEIKRLSTLIASWVCAEDHPLFGEIAIDMGVDERGKVWIIELNAIPGRTVFRQIGAAKALAKAISRPMEYASFLSGFGPLTSKE